MIVTLSDAEIGEALATLPEWTHDLERRALHRRVALADFPAAMAFMMRVAFAAQAMNHHPEWTNVYNRIDIWLTTHDAGGITAYDVSLAQRIDGLLA
ncbi:4a-hydroxytetrahydrobiopterin dehydratase [Novosphingobium pituita]|jgi:4a-hydroxytetrahydrobiopterin dehydratase|uniref:Putative pterin-4-alpha-carbinolamine dehydratase n=1 Tax=Novosphingobium pituita TaxID=3056842 RepID=A0ABQ6P4L5_9SPHN|nr:4a-hydroxytetrahydrobiopterin dehydratase [Novosphingobium sp. IK01]MDK4806171.1 4a-hydroxytetrahydrobiopterin dehydratase [Novosphingobium aromaticivorans]GMM60213.1 4a-hydroxytetrahydrobiopterin dehydratase [Novosphingobium sp. IK01]HIQ16654.1 4a-hydroxytetrahydrobiopterin dehydratase [Novosphingobium capsulatum]